MGQKIKDYVWIYLISSMNYWAKSLHNLLFIVLDSYKHPVVYGASVT